MPVDNTMLGASFVPTTENAQLGPQRGLTEGVQQALKIISLRLPEVLGTSAIAPRGLLLPQARAVTPDTILAEVLRRMALPNAIAESSLDPYVETANNAGTNALPSFIAQKAPAQYRPPEFQGGGFRPEYNAAGDPYKFGASWPNPVEL